MGYRIILHHDTLGVTQRALQALRNELANRITHHIAVFEIPTPGTDLFPTYGFFIVDLDVHEVAIIGDGFRGDDGGEGGSGHRAANALLAIYGINPQVLPEEAIHYTDDESMYREPAEMIAELAIEYGFKQPYFNKPQYVDWVFSKRFSH